VLILRPTDSAVFQRKRVFTCHRCNIYIIWVHRNTRVFECNVVSKFRSNRRRTFGDLRFWTNEHLHFIYIDLTTSIVNCIISRRIMIWNGCGRKRVLIRITVPKVAWRGGGPRKSVVRISVVLTYIRNGHLSNIYLGSIILWINWVSLFAIATDYELNDRGLISGRGKIFSLFFSVETGSGAHSASSGNSFP
jgi:hypothetical protein